ncbi:amino acid ABC transporter substrate-binding protein, PAAT family (TC 3.A.1.3.-) [Caminicella sporogenes DSM 14501]|uniref:Amino acid ABC transporter substrate-binding protein, PAAT family (TC 3.A.1.3.-) n=1 Tax=Caminicella sporogenes DSM 14501 TaxID=1121266 RepID=A0A1M6TMG8_9FIRM|nr:transporter substrate-binding domain-containing protein [Caminicella sporogenes]RKD22346.1 amino acid ABC transporter substrate-binding protein [Caminicella sporogenes]SHK57988.1 amino acid ABC transporter substrate-binding protein, PAAT family (TC 3.A.1.3.-) [Caminicella sporogenes DSM 14501]
MFKKIAITLILTIITTVMFIGCSKTTTSSNNTPTEKIIKVGTGGTYNPWCFQQDGKIQGFEIDVWKELSKRTGYKVEFIVSKFSGLFGMLDAGQIDTIAHQISIRKDRQEKYYFTEPYAFSKYDFIIRKDSPFKTIEDLKGKKVGAWLGGNGEKTLKELNEKYKLGLNIVLYDGAPLEKEVETGRLDACWQAAIKSQTVIKQGNLKVKLMGVNTEIGTEINAYPFLKNDSNKQIIKEINKAIKSMHEDGTLTQLSNKWFNLDTTKK